MHSILITAECVADIPKNIPYDDIEVIYYDIQTEGGLFRDTKEIMSDNVLEYMAGGEKKAISIIPSAADYKNFFSKMLEEYDDIIHISVSSGISGAYENANLARAKLGRNSGHVYIVDSQTLSAAQGLIVLEAARCREEGQNCKEIVDSITEYAKKIEITFLSESADYLYYNGKVSKTVMDVCNTLHLHPVLAIINGKMTVKGVYIGNLRKCGIRYLRKTLGKIENIDNSIGYLVYSGCSEDHANHIKAELEKKIHFDTLYEGNASATVSCNSGPNTFGIIFARKES